MKIAASVGYLGFFGSIRHDLEFAREAERLGYESLWVGEPYGADAVSALSAFAMVTERMLLGSAVLVMPGRSAAMTAQSAASIDLLSDGRLLLGLGTSGPQVAEGWHGVRFSQPLVWTREYVDVVRMALRRERVAYAGQKITLPLPGGPGKSLRLILHPQRSQVPIYLAALGPKSLSQCGEIADGWLPLWFAPEFAPAQLESLAAGAAKAGRSVDEICVSPTVPFRVSSDREAARLPAKDALALYIGGMGSRDQNFYNRLISAQGYADECRTVQDLYLAGRKAAAAAAIPDSLVDLLCLCGPVELIRDRLAAYRGIVDRLIAAPMASSGEDRLEQLRLFKSAADQVA